MASANPPKFFVPTSPQPDALAHVPKKWKQAAREHDARIDADEARRHAARDVVEQAGIDSFPASDPPARTLTTGPMIQ
jgi:hypothetical protein